MRIMGVRRYYDIVVAPSPTWPITSVFDTTKRLQRAYLRNPDAAE